MTSSPLSPRSPRTPAIPRTARAGHAGASTAQRKASLHGAAPQAGTPALPAKRSFKAQMLIAREQAIIEAVNRLLADKGFDLMTVDEVAAEVGIAKASLYKHFASKEDLAAAAMVRVMGLAHGFLSTLPQDGDPLAQLKAAAGWMLRQQLAGEMPSLPSQNSSLVATLMGNKAYLDGLMAVSERIGGWIEAAQASGAIDPAMPPLLVLYTLYARACDPVPGFMKASGQHSDEEIVQLVLGSCFNGLGARPITTGAAPVGPPARG